MEAAAANALGNILDPDTLADAPLTEQGLQNLVASVSEDLSDAFLDAAQIITADFGIAEFTDFSVETTFFDTLDYSDIPAIEVRPASASVVWLSLMVLYVQRYKPGQ